MNFKCLFGHKLNIVRAVSRQTALCACENCGAEYAVKMEGEHAGARIKWTVAKDFYEKYIILDFFRKNVYYQIYD